jgi:hypothetical protein
MHELNKKGDSTPFSDCGLGRCILDNNGGAKMREGVPRFICHPDSIWNRHAQNPA